MNIPHEQELVDAVYELDNICFNKAECTIVIRVGYTDEGSVYYDASMYTGHNEIDGEYIADIIGAQTFEEMIKELVKEL